MTHHAHSGEPAAPVGLVLHNPIRYDIRLWLMSRGREGKFRRQLVELGGVKPGDAVLDIGCGTGSLAIEAAKVVGPKGSVVGVDPSDEMVGRAQAKGRRSRTNVRFQKGIAQELPFADASFDVVLCTFVLHQLPHEAWHKAKTEAARVLKPGGRLLLVDIGGDQTGKGPHHKLAAQHGMHLFDLREIGPMFAGNGLEQVAAGEVPYQLSFFERVQYLVLSRNASVS
jgi:ubiquinone/menaquinone biosynthesis C-methylase UbiE